MKADWLLTTQSRTVRSLPQPTYYMPAMTCCYQPIFSYQPFCNPFFNPFFNQMSLQLSLFSQLQQMTKSITSLFEPKSKGQNFDSNNFMNFDTSATSTNYYSSTVDLSLNTGKTQKTKKSRRKTRNRNHAIKTTTSLKDVAKIYDKEKGAKIAKETIEGLSNAQKGYCATAVKTGILNAGLGEYESGHAKDVPDILSRNKNFTEVRVAKRDMDKLPAGCIVCYPPGDCGYSSTYGHVATTDGKGKGIHFQIDNLKSSSNARVFVPTMA